MNYLAHIHIAEHTQTSLLGNFLGDFVKGNPDGKFSQNVVNGIRLHRFVDSYTDRHAVVKSTKYLFDKDVRRFAPIALDMFWDHCLAKHWALFHGHSLRDFCVQAEAIIDAEKNEISQPLPVHFEEVSKRVWQGQWFEHYREIHNIDFALRRIATRSPRMAPLSDTFETLVANYDLLNEAFFELYPDLLMAAMNETKKETT